MNNNEPPNSTFTHDKRSVDRKPLIDAAKPSITGKHSPIYKILKW